MFVHHLCQKFHIFYYISPQGWAWRKKRISLIKQIVEKIIVIFKFEEKFYQNEGIDALYFGHPLLDVIKKQGINTKKIMIKQIESKVDDSINSIWQNGENNKLPNSFEQMLKKAVLPSSQENEK